MSDAATVAKEKLSRRVTLSRRASFWAAAAFAVLAFSANTAASPLYRVYENQFRFSPTTLTMLFTVYIVVLLATLLLFGSVSDYSGRRTVLLAGLAFGAGGCGLFLIAHGVGLLFAARALQGVAVGLISGAASAALLDLRPESGITPVVSSAAPTGGQALGAIGASALAQYAPAPIHLVWWLLLGAFTIGVVAVLAMPEPGTMRPGRELAPAAGQRAARGQARLRHGGAGPRGDLGARRLLSVAGALACRAAVALEEPDLGRHLDLPAHRARGRGLDPARSEESAGGDAGRLRHSDRRRRRDIRLD
jgi:MFS family permease